MKRSPAILVLFSVLILFSCKKSAVEQNRSQLKGSLLLANEGGKLLDDKSGMTISIENSDPLISTVSDKQGNFVLPDYPASSFVLVYSKRGYGTYKQYFERDYTGKLLYWTLNGEKIIADVNQIGPGQELGEKSTTTINALKTQIIGDTLQISFNLSSPTPGQKYIELLAQKDLPDISFTTIDKNRYNWHFEYAAQKGDNTFNFCLKCSTLCNDWVSGDVIYFTAYGESYYCDMYIDRLNNNSIVMPNMNTSNTVAPVSVVVP
jgi:hypothetical protein